MLSKNKEYVVDIVDIGQGGVGIGKYEGFTVFIEGGLIPVSYTHLDVYKRQFIFRKYIRCIPVRKCWYEGIHETIKAR